jgi:uncharacterized protein (DUF952 family)
MASPDPPPDVTYHLVAGEYWRAQASAGDYVPGAFASDGFIHCTDGVHNVIDTANRYYRDDPRDYVVLVIDLARVRAEIRYEDDAGIYPHIYGSLNRDAIAGVTAVTRATDGTFLSFDG